jgi:hypothetical protein
MSLQALVLNLRNGAILATLSAIPVIVGFVWNAVWGESERVSWGTYTALLLAWLGAAGVVAGISISALREGSNLSWSYPCPTCKHRVYLIQYHCSNCGAAFTAPPAAIAFRNALLLGVTVFYATFGLAAFVLRF